MKLRWDKWIRWLGITCFLVSPPIGAWYVNEKMKQMEKGVHDDLNRIKMKGKTVGDIPRKQQ